MTLEVKITEGFADFHVPSAGKPCQTWYKIFGDISSAKGRPLVTLHGGPGAGHSYLIPIAALASLYDIPVIFYDQLGTGNSTHLQEKKGDGKFWTEELFCDELENLLHHLGIQHNFDLLGHSWGGMLGARFVTHRLFGPKHLIISNSPASMELWVKAANKLRSKLPQDIQAILTKHEREGTTDSKEYEEATNFYNNLHVCRLDPQPDEVKASFRNIAEDSTVYMTMNGPNEFFVVGTLKTWSIIDELHKIRAPTLLINGHYDEAQDEVVLPFFTNIRKVKWVQFAESSHMPQWEEKEKYVRVVGEFLTTASD